MSNNIQLGSPCTGSSFKNCASPSFDTNLQNTKCEGLTNSVDFTTKNEIYNKTASIYQKIYVVANNDVFRSEVNQSTGLITATKINV